MVSDLVVKTYIFLKISNFICSDVITGAGQVLSVSVTLPLLILSVLTVILCVV